MNSVPKIGIGVAAVVVAFVVSALGALLMHAPSLNFIQVWQDPYYRHVTQFSFYQASLSMILSVGFAIPVSHALYRRRFFGRNLLIRLFATTLVLPVLVGVFGLLAIYGNSGLLAQLFHWLDARLPFSIYGLFLILRFFVLSSACSLS